jgi:hypothetical protein
MIRRLLLLATMLLPVARSAAAGDIYLFQAHAEGPRVFDATADGAAIIEWSTDAFFFNTSTTDAVVALLDDYEGMQFIVPAQRSVSLSTVLPPRIFGFLHASVPDGVVVENALLIGSVQDTIPTLPTPPIYRYGKVQVPVFRALVPRNTPQVHLATFLGEQQSHLNVWIYNGATVSAQAHIEVRRQCDDAIVDETTTIVGPKNSLVVGSLASGFAGCRVPGATVSWIGGSIYTIVTVDQPSLSFVSTVANGRIPQAMVSIN